MGTALVLLWMLWTGQGSQPQPAPHAESKAPRFVHIVVRVDERDIEEPVRIWLEINDEWVQPLSFENGFVVPDQIWEQEATNVKVAIGKKTIRLPELHSSAFDTDWVIGIDYPPFAPENVSALSRNKAERRQEVQRIAWMYYISFQPRDAEGTRRSWYVYKRPKRAAPGNPK